MSNENDLIRRGDVLRLLPRDAPLRQYVHDAVYDKVAALPAVPPFQSGRLGRAAVALEDATQEYGRQSRGMAMPEPGTVAPISPRYYAAERALREADKEFREAMIAYRATSRDTSASFSPEVAKAVRLAVQYGGIDGSHHKTWVIDQIVRALTGPKYEEIIREAKAGENGPDTYEWDEGIAP